MILLINVQKIVLIIGWLAFILLVFFIIYRLIVKKFKQKNKDKRLFDELYINLAPIDQHPARGIVPIYIETKTPIEVKLHLFSNDKKVDEIIETRTLKKGGNVLQLDTTKYNNGVYFYEAVTANQKTRKMFEIRNELKQ